MPTHPRFPRQSRSWNEKYPDIKIEGYDLGGDDVLSKTLGEQTSGLFVGDVWFSSGWARNLLEPSLPKEFCLAASSRSIKVRDELHPAVVDGTIWHHHPCL